ncbi:MAG: ATP-binding protein [Spirochaetia bacterium]|jgi:signal transduction histidine kinase
MPEGGIFTVLTGTEAGNAFLSVSDTGMGRDGNAAERAFAPSFTTRDFGKSASWGLAVAGGIMRQHGDDVRVANVRGVGTTFTFTLPLIAT